MTESLEDILSDTQEAVEEPAEQTPEAPAEEPKAAEEKPQESGEAKEPEKEDSTPESESWTKAAVMDERRKRQALERELEQLRKPKAEPKRPDVFEDPDGAFSHMQQQFQQELATQRIAMSRDNMQMLKPDYDDMEQVFIKMAEDNPALVEQMRSHPNPARFAYEQATKHREYQQMQDVDSYKAKLREEVKAELLKEMEADKAKEAQKDEAVTPSLAKQRSSGGQDQPVDASLEDILGR